MRALRFLALASLVIGVESAQAGGFLSKLLSRPEDEGRTLLGRYKGVKLLELEVVDRPAGPVAADETARLTFRVKQLNNPDPQYLPPPVRVRRFSLAGHQLGQQWLTPNGEGIYETSVPMHEAGMHYLYFETGTNLTILKKVPWVVLKAASAN